ncbi:PREDICTED: uncharacterized protein LOC105567003 [Vollenhovia emeryi]|uniref:uncharacterized protein LOC105567003 n=1 Tax=Vollenhovia emeryi TaxID=411798 RepID=UPI0005F418FC|nr:PREDICTED: uncharacterized protein LOC105567003 [Vollenhovia emeryi]
MPSRTRRAGRKYQLRRLAYEYRHAPATDIGLGITPSSYLQETIESEPFKLTSLSDEYPDLPPRDIPEEDPRRSLESRDEFLDNSYGGASPTSSTKEKQIFHKMVKRGHRSGRQHRGRMEKYLRRLRKVLVIVLNVFDQFLLDTTAARSGTLRRELNIQDQPAASRNFSVSSDSTLQHREASISRIPQIIEEDEDTLPYPDWQSDDNNASKTSTSTNVD